MNPAKPTLASIAFWQLAEVRGRQLLRLGRQWLLLDDVRQFRVHQVAERDNDGLLFNFALFAMLAAAIVVPVVQLILAPKFLIAAALLGAIALMSLAEVLGTRKTTHYRIDVTLAGGEAVTFVTHRLEEVNAVMAILARCHGRAIA